ncbi:hypothetical protein QJS10_CPA07g00947 [Acorus calamus]|uniref:Protein kinase domain-containing protein n=1 Tax=Acorus calamus TaxID=4465 RepID=A0AAV9EHC9_ACOCL|nr:hypothetical protein QJS10_CPA07g00947 [Acorus calamus]
MSGSNVNQKRGKGEAAEKVVVAVKASKEIPRTALVWALTHVVQPGDCITLLVVVPSQSSGRKLWGFPIFAGDCASGHRRSHLGTTLEQKSDISDSCSQLMLQLHEVYDPNKINVKIKIVSGSPCGAVVVEAKKAQANWVVLDKQLKHEEKQCMEELQCNIVVMKRSQPKVLRLNLGGSPKTEYQVACSLPLPPELEEASEKPMKNTNNSLHSIRGPAVTPNSSPDLGTPFTATEAGTSSVSSSDPGASPFFISEINALLKKDSLANVKENRNLDVTSSDSDSGNSSPSTSIDFQPWMSEIITSDCPSSKKIVDKSQISTAKALLEKFSKLDKEAGIGTLNYRTDVEFSGNVRDAVSLSRSAPSGPPPLCSICQHKAPVFGKPPRWFSYAELELATGRKREPLEWSARQKIAVGAARGLRYLHEECRVGCIVHRDMRPNNILITHDYEPLVGDFGLARWQPDGDLGVETRVIGTFGYLAPEYAQSGQITEKADVYSFGVVLVELVTGRKAVDINRPKGQQCLTEWARPLLEEFAFEELIDPRLGNSYSEQEVYCMLQAASLCIRRDPHLRPRMSQVLRILEGNMTMDSNYATTPDSRNRSRRMWAEQQQPYINLYMGDASEGMGNAKISYEALRKAYWEREKARRASSYNYDEGEVQ